MILDNLGLVRYAMRLYRLYPPEGMDAEDLMQEGTLALIKAVDRFDPSLGYRFSTYAIHSIGMHLRFIVRETLRRAVPTLSLDITADEMLTSICYELVVGESGDDWAEEMDTKEALQRLREQEPEIIPRVLAGMTQREIAHELGVSQPTVSRRLRRLLEAS